MQSKIYSSQSIVKGYNTQHGTPKLGAKVAACMVLASSGNSEVNFEMTYD
jgi:hypothetical protein